MLINISIPLDTSDCIDKFFNNETEELVLQYEHLFQAMRARNKLIAEGVNRIQYKKEKGKHFIIIPFSEGFTKIIPVTECAPSTCTRTGDTLMKHLKTGPEPVWPPKVVDEETMLKREKRWSKKRNLTPAEREEIILLEQADWDSDLPVEFKITRHRFPVNDMNRGKMEEIPAWMMELIS